MTLAETSPGNPVRLNLFCGREGDAWRVYARPGALPRCLDQCFDEHFETYPVLLDFEDLERNMEGAGAKFDQRWTRLGSVELTADGADAEALGAWLSTAIASGFRPRVSGAGSVPAGS